MCIKFPILGVLNYLKETFTHTPSYDMSPAMLSVLVKMMLAQAQESVFDKICLPGIRNEFFMLVKVAHEAAKVSVPGPCDFRGGEKALVWAPWKQSVFPWQLDPGTVPSPARALACIFLASTGVSDTDH